ncbi:alpha/beta-hydrolase [Parathielavia appendiculata]|uniref:Alpha/beta-hydrolase n=1 Tax=Parathielavia appendiculata TaxID=2587402 RepID=A0AAN6U7P3_9PEZI|nr:alpha/beta-hydrolase [Parathielavia appendiculata]
MFDENPSLIQEGPDPSENDDVASPWPKKPTPLVLIHDGGGTIFSYHCLGDLGRPVYGIANPRYEHESGEPSTIPEMARQYLQFIKSAVPSGDVIIGGWSLGGLISLEVARQMADDWDTSLNLLGIVMIDSVCPMVLRAPRLQLLQHVMQWSEHTKQETRERVTRCFAEAVRMVGEWTLPVWERTQEKGSRASIARRPPPVILLRAMYKVPVTGDGVTRVDIHRLDRQLGWGNYRQDLITKVIDIPGHHFNIFHTEDNLNATTEAISRACLELEGASGEGVGEDKRFCDFGDHH